MKKQTLSKRFIGNLLIVLFGLVILFITSLVVYKGFFASADPNNVFVGDGHDLDFTYSAETIAAVPASKYSISSISGSSLPFLKIYNTAEISSVMGSSSSIHPAYIVPYQSNPDSDGNYITASMAIVPMPPYNYTYGDLAASSSATRKFLVWAKGKAQGSNNGPDVQALSSAITLYDHAALLAASNFRVAGNLVLTKDPSVLALCTDSLGICDSDVTSESITSATQSQYAYGVRIDDSYHYSKPHANSLALAVLHSASAEADNIGDTINKTKIDAAVANYNRQIQGDSSSSGLTISSVGTIQHSESQVVTFSVKLSGLNMTNGASLDRVLFNIDQKTFCNIDFNGSDSQLTSDSTGCTWDGAKRSGTFDWGPDTSQDTSTSNPAARTLMLKAYSTLSGDNSFGNVSKTVTVLPAVGDIVTPGGGSVPMTVTTPASVDLSNQATAKNVQIKITASNLNPNNLTNTTGPGRVGKISWYICTASQDTITNNDSTGCFEKGSFGPFVQNEITIASPKVVTWDASGSTAGTYTVMLKVFGLKANASDATYPEYDGTSPVVSANITVVKNMTGGDETGGNGGDGTTGGSVTPGWAANLQKSALTTIDGLVHKIGSFSLLIMGIVAILAIILAGMKYITAGGDSKGAETGKKAILFSVYGIVGAVLCVMLVRTTIAEVQGIIGNSPDPVSNTNTIVPTSFGGPNASIMDIIGHNNGFIWRIIQLAIYYAEVVAVFLILYGSFLYITSLGDDSKAENAKKTIVWAVIGLAVILSANVLINTFGLIVA
ncbi:MAG: pilin [Candidatus Berkelbacteria bacterium]